MSTKMKKYIITLLLFAFPLAAFSSDWKYELSDALSKSQNAEGVTQYKVNMEVIDYYISRIAEHAKEYPPRFRSQEEYNDVAERLEKLIGVLSIIGENQQQNAEFLLRSAFVQSMAHNINMKGSADKAKEDFVKLLKLDPDNIKGNYLYGMFLSGTQKYHFESIPYLEKAFSLGETDAQYTLGLLYFQQGDKDKGLKYLREYAKNNPDQERVKKVISAIETGNLQFKHD
jgi:tetratricopeptide (TPR) repeat protein